MQDIKKSYQNLTTALENLIRREERFAKTAVGWVHREISKFDFDYVINFLEANVKMLSKEELNNTLKDSDKISKETFVSE